MISVKGESITITDSLGQLAQSTKVEVPEGQIGSEFNPTGSIIDVSVEYDGTLLEHLGGGAVTYIDYKRDGNSRMATLVATGLPASNNHRTPVSMAFDFSEGHGTSVQVYQSVCREAGVPAVGGLVPDYTMVGVYEVIRQTAHQCALALAAPFQQSGFIEYFPRYVEGGMTILKIDWLKSISNRNNVEPEWASSFEQHHEAVIPDIKIGDGHILLTGGDKYGVGRFQSSFSVVYSFRGSSRNNQAMANFTRWAEQDTTVLFECRYTGEAPASGSDYLTLDDVVALLAVPPEDGQPPNEIQVIGSYVLKDETREYDGASGLISRTTTTSFYGLQFREDDDGTPEEVVPDTASPSNNYLSSNGLIEIINQQGLDPSSNRPAKAVKTFDTRLKRVYPGGQEIETERVDTRYSYDKGELTSSASTTYMKFRDVWITTDSNIELNADISVEFAKRGLPSPLEPISKIQEQRDADRRVPIGRYQLLDGVPPETRLKQLLQGDYGTQKTALTQYEWDRTSAYTIDCPCMDYGGLGLVWIAVQRARAAEQALYFWELTDIKGPYNPNYVVGSGGEWGMVVGVTHEITGNRAETTVNFKQLVRT